MSSVYVYVYSLVSAVVSEVVVVEGERGVEGSMKGVSVTMRCQRTSKGTPTRYILILSFLHHCLPGSKAPCCNNPAVSTTPAIVRNRESPLGLFASLGKILRGHFLGIGHEYDWLSLWKRKA